MAITRLSTQEVKNIVNSDSSQICGLASFSVLLGAFCKNSCAKELFFLLLGHAFFFFTFKHIGKRLRKKKGFFFSGGKSNSSRAFSSVLYVTRQLFWFVTASSTS